MVIRSPGWPVIHQKFMEQYLKMEKYQVFNPLTGVYTFCEDETAMRALVLTISNQILSAYPVSINKETADENGNTTWTNYILTTPISAKFG